MGLKKRMDLRKRIVFERGVTAYFGYFRHSDAGFDVDMHHNEITLSLDKEDGIRHLYKVAFESPDNPVTEPNPLEMHKYRILKGYKQTWDSMDGAIPWGDITKKDFDFWKRALNKMMKSIPEDNVGDLFQMQKIVAIWNKARETLFT